MYLEVKIMHWDPVHPPKPNRFPVGQWSACSYYIYEQGFMPIKPSYNVGVYVGMCLPGCSKFKVHS